MKSKILIVAALLISSSVFSQQDSSYKLLDEVVFTAGKYPRKQSETGKVITVITKEQLEQNNGKTIAEILNTVSGTTIIGANNNLGTNLTASIRGSSAGNVLILLDGIPVYDPSALANYFDLNSIAIDMVERIEILKGGHSTLYGSDAVAGMINIITTKINSKAFLINTGIQAGSYNTLKQNLAVAGKLKELQYDLQMSNINSTGFSSAHDSTGNKGFDNDGFHQQTINLRLNQKFSTRLQANVSGMYSLYKTDLDESAFIDDKDFISKNKNQQINTGLNYTTNKTNVRFNYQYNNTERNYLNDSISRGNPSFYFNKSKYNGSSHIAEIFANRKWAKTELVLGFDYRNNNTNQEYLSVSSYGPYKTFLGDTLAKANQVSAFTSFVFKSNKFSTEAGIRWNNHSVYGNNFTYTFNPFYELNKKTKLFVNIYSAFKTPTLYQLFDPFSGNKKLNAENSNVFESGLHYTDSKFNTRLVGFYRNTKNAIQYVITNPVWFSGEYQNAKKQINYGLEYEATYTLSKWNLNFNYSLTKGEIKSNYDASGNKLKKDTTYNGLYRVPEHSINFSAGYQLSKFIYLNFQLRKVSERLEPVYAAAPKKLNPYYTININGDYKISKKLNFFIALNNLTDQKYFDILGYNARRFNFNSGINLKL